MKTIQTWESGKRSPNHAALRLLGEIVDHGSYTQHVIIDTRRSQHQIAVQSR